MSAWFSALPAVLGMGLLAGVAALPWFRVVEDPRQAAGAARLSALDGLRGLLAPCVFFYHAALYPRFLADGAWDAPDSAFYGLLGGAAVSLFFMITGYLFWAKLLRERGRPRWGHL